MPNYRKWPKAEWRLWSRDSRKSGRKVCSAPCLEVSGGPLTRTSRDLAAAVPIGRNRLRKRITEQEVSRHSIAALTGGRPQRPLKYSGVSGGRQSAEQQFFHPRISPETYVSLQLGKRLNWQKPMESGDSFASLIVTTKMGKGSRTESPAVTV